ncbi:MAG: alpha/beta hydrolase [Bacilli bacterium]|nr:alpha/beta hydrolase [Bacilli bacterium]
MKFGSFFVGLLVRLQNKSEAKRRKPFPSEIPVEAKLDVPYLDDGNFYHKIDVFLAKEKRNDICLVDIHGGSYIFGMRKNNHYFASKFVKEGFDFICVDYIPNDKKRGTDSMIKDVASCLSFIASHKEELGIEGDQFALLGDSAGGHMALFMQELSESKKMQETLGFGVGDFSSYAVALNCPVYDYKIAIDSSTLTKGGRRRMFGPDANDFEFADRYSPRTYIDEESAPIFASTFTNDFLRGHPLLMKQELLALKRENFEILDIEENDKNIAHVHNLIAPDLEQSIRVNEAIIAFLLNYADKKNS